MNFTFGVRSRRLGPDNVLVGWVIKDDTTRHTNVHVNVIFTFSELHYLRTNVSVREEINSIHIHKQVPLIVSVRKRKLQFFGHIVRSGCLSWTFLQGCVAGGRGRGRPRMSWLDNIISWTALDVQSLLAAARDRFYGARFFILAL